jgi:hypothetical protein
MTTGAHQSGHPARSYAARTPFVDGPITDLAVFCSDARFGAQSEEFIAGLLGHSRFDRLVAPGGPACMLDWTTVLHEDIETIARLKWFLIENHEIDRVILIAHEGCAYYIIKLGVEPGGLVQKQRSDLGRLACRIRDVKPGLRVDAYLALVDGDRVVFQTVET